MQTIFIKKMQWQLSRVHTSAKAANVTKPLPLNKRHVTHLPMRSMVVPTPNHIPKPTLILVRT